MNKPLFALLAFLLLPTLAAGGGDPAPASRIPILVDTDIGTDIDDAFALALILRSPELDLVGVTTVSGDTQARARLAAKLLWVAGRSDVPVAAGEPGKPLPIDQTRWADGFLSPQLVSKGAVEFMRDQINARPNLLTLVTIGPLTNIAALLRQDPGVAGKIKQIAMMGGALAHGYGTSPTPVPEYNIAADPAAAQAVFSSGIPVLMAPLDSTAMLELTVNARHRVFSELDPVTNALTILYHLWNGPTPILFDALPVALLIDPALAETQRLAIEVDQKGMTVIAAGNVPNATVALKASPQKFFDFYLKRVAP